MFECRDEHEEARLVCDEVVKLLRDRPASDVAVFYRVNAQSRVIEDMLVRQGVPYRVVGGTKFYQRAEIKDLLAYLRVTLNATDDLSLLRVINTPRRGLGDVAIGRLQACAAENGIALREALLQAPLIGGFTNAAAQACVRLGECFCEWAATSGAGDRGTAGDVPRAPSRPPPPSAGADAGTAKVADLVRRVLEESGMMAAFKAERTLEAEGRVENLEEFVGVAGEFDRMNPEGTLADFLQEISLYADVDSLEEGEPYVTLMTLHNAKGLEFPVVFLTGMEEGLCSRTPARWTSSGWRRSAVSATWASRGRRTGCICRTLCRACCRGAPATGYPAGFWASCRRNCCSTGRPRSIRTGRGRRAVRVARGGWGGSGYGAPNREGERRSRRPASRSRRRRRGPGRRAARQVAGLATGDKVDARQVRRGRGAGHGARRHRAGVLRRTGRAEAPALGVRAAQEGVGRQAGARTPELSWRWACP